LADFHGALMVDGYEGYDPVCRDNGITRLGCWAHARRGFVDAQRQQPKGKTGKPDQALAHINALYRVERSLKDTSTEDRYRERQRQAHPILEKLRAWLDISLPNTAPKTSLGKALTYLDNQWSRLERYVDDGRYPIDNNPAENAIRPFVIGRKNWLFSQSTRGVQASANLYSLIETARANNLDPWRYLNRVLIDLPKAESVDDIDALLPGSFKTGD
jgi:transposase